MGTIDPEQLRLRIEERRKRKIAEVEAEYSNDMQALDRVASLASEPDGAPVYSPLAAAAKLPAAPTVPMPARLATPRKPPVSAGKASVVNPPAVSREAVGTFTGEFSKNDIRDYAAMHYPQLTLSPNDLSGILNKMRKNGTIVIVRESTGKTAAVYRHAQPPAAPGGQTDEREGEDGD